MDLLPQNNVEYNTSAYWDRRYAQEAPGTTFDWFSKTYSDLSALFADFIPEKKVRICMLGCGNSTLSQDLYDEGYTNIVNVDYSAVIIERMKETHAEKRPSMSWIEGDIRSLPFGDQEFDVAIDKGTMDALMCSKGDVWDPPEEVVKNCAGEIDEVVRILKPGGNFLYITFGQPHFRKPHLVRPGIWEVETRQLGGDSAGFHYFFYRMQKKTDK